MDYTEMDEFESGWSYSRAWVWDDLHSILSQEESLEWKRETDFGTLIEILGDMNNNQPYDQRRRVLENFGYLLKHNVASLDDSDVLLQEDEELVQNLIYIHEGRISDDDSIKICLRNLKRLFS